MKIFSKFIAIIYFPPHREHIKNTKKVVIIHLIMPTGNLGKQKSVPVKQVFQSNIYLFELLYCEQVTIIYLSDR